MINEKFGETEYQHGNEPDVLSEYLEDAVPEQHPPGFPLLEDDAIKHVRGDEVIKKIR